MPFVKENLNQVIETKRNTDAVFKKTWDESWEEYRLLGEMVSLRDCPDDTWRNIRIKRSMTP